MWRLISIIFYLIGQSASIYKENDKIFKIDSSNYEYFVEHETKPIILHAYAVPSQASKDAAKDFKAAAEELHELAKFACLQVNKNEDLAHELDIKKPNTFYIIRQGQLKQFVGPISSKYILSLVMNQVLEHLEASEETRFQYFFKNVVQLTDENFDENVLKGNTPWMVLFHSPKFRETKNMIPLWYEVAQTLKDRVKFGSVDCSTNLALANEYEVSSYPTGILLVNEATYYLHYNVHLTSTFIVEWVNNKIKEYDEESKLSELSSQYRYDKCLEKPLCIIVFLPHISECQAKCRSSLLKDVKEIYNKYDDYKWGWLWAEGSSQGDLERSLGVDSFNIPTAVAINTEKKKFINLRGPFSVRGVDDFLKDILMMKVPSSDMKRYVRIYETEEWDGKDVVGKRNTFDFFDVDIKQKTEL